MWNVLSVQMRTLTSGNDMEYSNSEKQDYS